jgi:hypothetical protein
MNTMEGSKRGMSGDQLKKKEREIDMAHEQVA